MPSIPTPPEAFSTVPLVFADHAVQAHALIKPGSSLFACTLMLPAANPIQTTAPYRCSAALHQPFCALHFVLSGILSVSCLTRQQPCLTLVETPDGMWYVGKQSVGILSLVNLVASVAAAFGAIVVLPSWSAHELGCKVAGLLEVAPLSPICVHGGDGWTCKGCECRCRPVRGRRRACAQWCA